MDGKVFEFHKLWKTMSVSSSIKNLLEAQRFIPFLVPSIALALYCTPKHPMDIGMDT